MKQTAVAIARPALGLASDRAETGGGLNWASPFVVVLMLYLSMHGFIPILMQGQGTADGVDGTTGLIAQLVFLSLFLLIALPSVPSLVRGCGLARPLIAIALVAALSCLWSQDPGMSLRRGIMLLAGTFFALFLHVRYQQRAQLKLLFATGMLAAGLSIFFALFLPRYGLDSTFHAGSWQGIYSQKNGCARACVFFMLPALVMWGRSARKTMIAGTALVILTFLLIMSGSVTAYILAAVMAPLTWSLRLAKKMPRNETVVAGLIAAAAVVAVAGVLASNLDQILAMLGRDSTFSGRAVVWQGAWEAITKHPLLGYGYSAFWTGLKGESANVILAARWMVPMAHDGFLDVWLQLGAVGLGLVVYALYRGLTAGLWCLRQIGGASMEWAVATVVFTVLSNLDETSLIALHELLWIAFCLAFLNLRAAMAHAKARPRVDRVQVVATELEFEPATV